MLTKIKSGVTFCFSVTLKLVKDQKCGWSECSRHGSGDNTKAWWRPGRGLRRNVSRVDNIYSYLLISTGYLLDIQDTGPGLVVIRASNNGHNLRTYPLRADKHGHLILSCLLLTSSIEHCGPWLVFANCRVAMCNVANNKVMQIVRDHQVSVFGL